MPKPSADHIPGKRRVFRHLPEPAESLAREIADELAARGYPEEQVVEIAAELAVSYMAERTPDADVSPEEILERVQHAVARLGRSQ